MARKTRDQMFLRRTETADIPGYGEIGVRLLPIAELNAWRAKVKQSPEESSRYLVALCICDESGEPIFDLNKLEDLDGYDFPIFKLIVDACIRINGLERKKPAATPEEANERHKIETAEAVKT